MGSVTGNTIASYRSALSTEFTERAARRIHQTESSNPLEDPRITRLVDGIRNSLAGADKIKREAKPRTMALTMAVMVELIRTTNKATNAPLARTRAIAAAALAVAAGLRPSELLGSYIHKNRSLKTEQLKLYLDPDGATQVGNVITTTDHRYVRAHPASTILSITQLDHCTLELYVSKTNQRSKPSLTMIGQPSVVATLLTWVQERYRCTLQGSQSFDLFHHNELPQLTTPTLIAELSLALNEIGLDGTLTGKCFRSGAASTLAGQGVAVSDINNNNRWTANSAMAFTYADRTAIQRRALEINRQMK